MSDYQYCPEMKAVILEDLLNHIIEGKPIDSTLEFQCKELNISIQGAKDYVSAIIDTKSK